MASRVVVALLRTWITLLTAVAVSTENWEVFENIQYLAVTTSTSWVDALRHCQSLTPRASLMRPTNRNAAFLSKIQLNQSDIWSDHSYTNGTWRWSDGFECKDLAPWASGHPQLPWEEHKCGALRRSTPWVISQPCQNTTHPYVCQASLEAQTSPTTPSTTSHYTSPTSSTPVTTSPSPTSSTPAPTSPSTSTHLPPPSWHAYKEYKYLPVELAMTWTLAADYCTKANNPGAYLAEPTTSNAAFLAKLTPSRNHRWAGIFYGGQWNWSGQDINWSDHAPWMPGFPFFSDLHQCGGFDPATEKIFNQNCQYYNYFICQAALDFTPSPTPQTSTPPPTTH